MIHAATYLPHVEKMELSSPAPHTHHAERFFAEYIQAVQQAFLSVFRKRASDAVISRFELLLSLRQQAMQDAITPHLGKAEKLQRAALRKESYDELYSALEAMPDIRHALIEAQAKFQDILSIARKHSTVNIIKAEQGESGSSADDITYTLMHFRHQKVKAADVQRYLDEIAAKFSLTSHPTNSASVAHTQSAIALEKVLSDTATRPEDILDAIDAFLASPVAAPRKTPLDELEELIPVFDNLFDASLLQRDAILTGLQMSGYADEGVTIRTAMLELEDWSASFDGDGNVNATKEAIEQGVARKHAWILGRYATMLEKMEHELTSTPDSYTLLQQLSDIRRAVAEGEYHSADEMLAAVEAWQNGYDAFYHGRHKGMDALIYQLQCFGFHGSKGNLRHDAKTLNAALGTLIDMAGITLPKPYADLSKDELSTLLTVWFSEPDRSILHRLQEIATNPSEVRHYLATLDYYDDTTARIIERLSFLAASPNCANKLIIAEATHPADAKTAMAMLFVTGNQVANPQAKQEIVMLVESVKDVEALPETVRSLAFDPIFQQHIAAMGRITVMIAHSDNRRRDGYSAGEVITRTEGKLAKLQQELWIEAVHKDCAPLLGMADRFGIPLYMFDGGGNDLMRGAAVNPGQTGKQHGHAAARESAPTIRTPQNTIQGDQARLLFGFPECAAMFLEMMVSQSMYAKAAVEKRIGVMLEEYCSLEDSPQRKLAEKLLSPHYQQQQLDAQHVAILFHDTARKAFRHYTYPLHDRENPFNKLFSHSGAWISTLLANRSSRSNQRGKGDIDRAKTVLQIRGDRTPLEQRAITGNLLFQLTGTYHLGLLGQVEAFEAIGDEAAHQMFHSSLPDRTHIVGAAQQLQMTDFDKAWLMMGKNRPDAAMITEWAAMFRESRANGISPPPEQTLAFMEDYGLKLAKKMFYAATGYDADDVFTDPARPFEMQDAYRTLLPELARQIDIRHAAHEPEHFALARQERIFSEYPDQPIPASMELTIVALVSALATDVRPALGPLAVRGAKGVATTFMEQAANHQQKIQPDIRTSLMTGNPFMAGVQSPFSNNEALKNLQVPSNLLLAFTV